MGDTCALSVRVDERLSARVDERIPEQRVLGGPWFHMMFPKPTLVSNMQWLEMSWLEASTVITLIHKVRKPMSLDQSSVAAMLCSWLCADLLHERRQG